MQSRSNANDRIVPLWSLQPSKVIKLRSMLIPMSSAANKSTSRNADRGPMPMAVAMAEEAVCEGVAEVPKALVEVGRVAVALKMVAVAGLHGEEEEGTEMLLHVGVVASRSLLDPPSSRTFFYVLPLPTDSAPDPF